MAINDGYIIIINQFGHGRTNVPSPFSKYRGGGYKVIQVGGYKVRQVGGYKVSLSLDFRMWGSIRSNRYFFVAANA